MWLAFFMVFVRIVRFAVFVGAVIVGFPLVIGGIGGFDVLCVVLRIFIVVIGG